MLECYRAQRSIPPMTHDAILSTAHFDATSGWQDNTLSYLRKSGFTDAALCATYTVGARSDSGIGRCSMFVVLVYVNAYKPEALHRGADIICNNFPKPLSCNPTIPLTSFPQNISHLAGRNHKMALYPVESTISDRHGTSTILPPEIRELILSNFSNSYDNAKTLSALALSSHALRTAANRVRFLSVWFVASDRQTVRREIDRIRALSEVLRQGKTLKTLQGVCDFIGEFVLRLAGDHWGTEDDEEENGDNGSGIILSCLYDGSVALILNSIFRNTSPLAIGPLFAPRRLVLEVRYASILGCTWDELEVSLSGALNSLVTTSQLTDLRLGCIRNVPLNLILTCSTLKQLHLGMSYFSPQALFSPRNLGPSNTTSAESSAVVGVELTSLSMQLDMTFESLINFRFADIRSPMFASLVSLKVTLTHFDSLKSLREILGATNRLEILEIAFLTVIGKFEVMSKKKRTRAYLLTGPQNDLVISLDALQSLHTLKVDFELEYGTGGTVSSLLTSSSLLKNSMPSSLEVLEIRIRIKDYPYRFSFPYLKNAMMVWDERLSGILSSRRNSDGSKDMKRVLVSTNIT
ncbi:hypothetical protein JR316_0011109 [Psilocybe cubensis]|uniref:Uncharacterized protein n=2 Tax=Psilocybe cubensis TaxID=181762 RepID=A0ACB8GN57_PSICU|nr:hypothetical protein JR316_0011109 [Psilocybe cubensis]KAH9477190.1 hypothetical protein JR316_0011109 [Psilocybe cubensis]